MIAILATLILIVSPFTVELNNIHYGYRNVYTGSVDIKPATLIIRNYKLIKEQLEADVTKFITIHGSDISIDMASLVRQFQPEQIDPSEPQLLYRCFDQTFIVVTLTPDPQSSPNILESLITMGRPSSQLDL